MYWSNFIWFALPSVLLWIAAGITVYKKEKSLKKITDLLMLSGILIFSIFIVGYWITNNRPPMRTIGETRLWYSFFIAVAGWITYRRWKYDWLLTVSSLLATLFVSINLLHPETDSKHLMPALQSIWFIPHVTSYILAYALFGAATSGAFIQLYRIKRDEKADPGLFNFIDDMVFIGCGLLFLGMLMGCVWAKEAWGHYWSWDPKETWAFVTSMTYLSYIHIRIQGKTNVKIALWILPIAFVLLLITWLGVAYLPSAGESIHTY